MSTIHEVAKAAGVSISTVSYALSGKRPVSEKTRLRIEHAVTALGYQPEAGARMLAGRRTNIFALTEPLRADTHAPTHMAFVLAAAVAARQRGYDILLLTDEQASEGMNRVAASKLVDAILVLDVAPDDERVAIARSMRTPTIFIGVPDDHSDLTCVDLDFGAVGHLAVDRLADAGYSRIVLLGQTEVSYRKSNFPRRLLHGVQARAAERGVDVAWVTTGEIATDIAVVRSAVETALDNGERAFIVHAVGDVHEVLLATLHERGLRVGVDVSVISAAASFDTTALPVKIDTIPLVPQRSCEYAVDLAVRHVEGERFLPEVHLLDPEYLAAGSIAPGRG
ncbi:LacI family DNA-binding transcriptional regulator [Microbacterium murale]|uniref:LacI family transcriptional regulator n=1 Tax=Microbacterium murale TaxID=1081040 RepID=A0ABQ1RM09_9MICO|nr:LacI family DNA-binding transcriptional regulator [Microbacterium murale]GGD74359.1 LacI family transcriptional regulator [Microbacterium murale]